MKILVTGGAGFLGSHLCDRLLTDGHDVTCLDNLLTGAKENLGGIDDPNFRAVQADVTSPIEWTGPLDRLYHLASPAAPRDFKELPIEIMMAGSEGVRHALELARATGARFFLASTSEVYGEPTVSPQPESYWGNVNPLSPKAVYDESKRFAEAMTCAYARTYGLEVRIARLFNAYGPRLRMTDGRLVSNFVRQAIQGEDITVHGDGGQKRCLCYVSDIVEGIVTVMEKGDGRPYNIGDDRIRTVMEMAEIITGLIASDSRIARQPAPPEMATIRQPDIARAKTELGWSPKIGLEEGLKRTIEDFRRRLGA